MKRILLSLGAFILCAATAEAGPIRNAVNRIRTSIKSVRAPKSCMPAVAVGTVPVSVRPGGAILPCPGGNCPTPVSK